MSIIKRRIIYLDGLDDFGKVKHLETILLDQKGVLEAVLDYGRGCVNVVYDLDAINLKTIESVIETNGFTLQNSYWQRFKRGLFHFFEENEYDNAHTSSSPCCSHPDEILSKAKNVSQKQ